MNLLVVEDDPHVAGPLVEALRRRGYEATGVGTAAEAQAALGFDLVLLDLGLPDRDGIEVCRTLRERSSMGIIALSGRGTEQDRVIGLRAGADDYVVKPFSVVELQARIDAVMRRAAARPAPQIRCGDLQMDLDRREACRAGRPLALTRKEFDLLAALLRGAGSVVTRDQLLLEVWHTGWRSTGRSLDVHVGTLRAKLGTPVLIETVRGIGYRLVVGAQA